MASFDVIKRERLLALIEAGMTAEQACAATGVGRTTVSRWVARGRKPDAPAEVRDFARRYLELREAQRAVPAQSNGNGNGPLSDDELVSVLEGAARRGSAESAEAVLARRRREQRAAEKAAPKLPEGHPLTYTTLDDPFVALHPLDMAHLTEEERRQARAAHRGGQDADPVLDACEQEAQEICREAAETGETLKEVWGRRSREDAEARRAAYLAKWQRKHGVAE